MTRLKATIATAAVGFAAILGTIHPASAMAASGIPESPADCQTTGNSGSWTVVNVTTCNGHATNMTAALHDGDTTTGFFSWWGPNGEIGSPSATKQWNGGELASKSISPPQAAPPGTKWCVKFLQGTSVRGGFKLLDTNCVTF
jgi:hypothetical protein